MLIYIQFLSAVLLKFELLKYQQCLLFIYIPSFGILMRKVESIVQHSIPKSPIGVQLG